MTLGPSPDDLTRLARVLDDVATERSRYRRSVRARELLLGPHDQTDAPRPDQPDPREIVGDDEIDPLADPDERIVDSLPIADRAAWWAMRYHLQIQGEPGSERATMEPDFEGPDGCDPPRPRDTPTDVVTVWAQLAELVSGAAAQATLRHLLFEAKAGDTRAHAQLAADAYRHLGETEGRATDGVLAARAAVRLARAVRDTERVDAALMTLLEVTQRATGGPTTSFRAAMDGVGTLLGEGSPEGTREVIDALRSTWSLGQQADQVLALLCSATTEPTERAELWRLRVENFLTMAERDESNILRSMRLRQALEVAELSGISELRDRATRKLQEVRHMDLEMMRIQASSRLFGEQWEEVVALILGDTQAADQVNHADSPEGSDQASPEPDPSAWARRLSSFGNFEPPTGDPEANRLLVAQRRAAAPLQTLFPLQMQTPEGLPLYAPATEEERLDLDLVRWETDLLDQWVSLLADALQRVAADGQPSAGAVERFLNAGPAMQGPLAAGMAAALARSLERYWSGDAEAAAFTAFPLIEALLRNALLSADRGIYRLQKKHTPGQYVGLGALLEMFAETYSISVRDRRFFNAVLNHPGGWNLRNLMAHGYVPSASAPLAALLIYAALRVLLLATGETTST